MKFNECSGLRLRRKIRKSIWKSEDDIARCEQDLQNAKSESAAMENDRNATEIERAIVKAQIKSLELTLAELTQSRDVYVREQKKPSPLLPRGVSA